jgi:hypothetical protein
VGGKNEAGEGGSQRDSPTHARYMVCNACKLDHSPLVRCEVHRRVINADAAVINADTVINRQVEWQRSNKDRYNARMREYMRTYRLKKKNLT